MRVGRKIALVGGIPVLIGAAIAATGWVLLAQQERARGGAILTGAVYRDLELTRPIRDQYVSAAPGARTAFAEAFAVLAKRAEAGLDGLAGDARTADQAARIAAARESLERYRAQWDAVVALTRANDALAAEMSQRAGSLIDVVERARLRQQGTNADLVRTLSAKLDAMRMSRRVATELGALRVAEAERALERARSGDAVAAEEALNGVGQVLSDLLRGDRREREADELDALTRPGAQAGAPEGESLAAWAERILRRDITHERGLHEDVARLLGYVVQANESEQATKTVAFRLLKLGQRTSGALQRRDPDIAAGMLGEGQELARSTAALPISPVIRGEMVQALLGWSERLQAMIQGLRRQNDMVGAVDRLSDAMSGRARALDETFVGDAERFGLFLQRLLLVGAVLGLSFGILVAVLVARSILVPLRMLQADMITLAAEPARARIAGTWRRDELGDIARATEFFVSEIARREAALRRAKERADAALADLRRTQDDLVRSEKLASLGQLVAGVAHEINTPLGIALTTATSVRDETRAFKAVVAAGTLSKSRLTFFLGRVEEGAGLMFANLSRAADLVHGFKQVAVDRVSDERRGVELGTWLDDLLASLQPLLRRGGHRIERECPEAVTIETNPGALAQVVTNLVNNAVVHAFPPGQSGRIGLRVERVEAAIRIEVEDDGRGIAAGDVERIFDPFFTTARGTGSTGLGMHIVHNLVTATLHGRIAVESEPGRGTRVRIELPEGAEHGRAPGRTLAGSG